MEKLAPPLKRYLMGARPSHSSKLKLHQNFKGLEKEVLDSVLEAGEYTSDGKATVKSKEEGLVDSCEGKILWRVEKVKEVLEGAGMKLERAAVNQEVELPANGEPVYANLGTIGTYFNVSAVQVGRWLDELDLREEDGMPTQEVVKSGLATFVEMHVEGKKTRKIAQWEVNLTKLKLVEAGHELDFNYEETLKGKGKNSDVSVNSLDQKVKEFTREFITLYKSADTRSRTRFLVQSTPKAILIKSETLMKKPGFLTRGEYLKNL